MAQTTMLLVAAMAGLVGSVLELAAAVVTARSHHHHRRDRDDEEGRGD